MVSGTFSNKHLEGALGHGRIEFLKFKDQRPKIKEQTSVNMIMEGVRVWNLKPAAEAKPTRAYSSE
uniref:Uncharacterized protein n=1 Tax=Pristionchus pacificus TaxID=54126 RepID=A0A2A6BND6_PRIPA|eukprot:PDM67326.1 hypothetical protein PRIPAC_48743 [Pristionchus pacificus]